MYLLPVCCICNGVAATLNCAVYKYARLFMRWRVRSHFRSLKYKILISALKIAFKYLQLELELRKNVDT